MEGSKKAPIHKICHTYPKMVKLCGYTLAKEIFILAKKYVNHVTHSMDSADISIFSSEILKFCYIKKCRNRLHFGT